MRKKHITFSAVAILGYLVFSSYAYGPASVNPNANYTGSPGSLGTCSSCHSGSNTSTTAVFSLVDKSNNQPVTNNTYVPGHMYTVTLKGANSGTLTKFGFQAVAYTSTNAQAGVFTLTGSNMQLSSLTNGRKIVEMSSMLTGSASSNLAVNFDWTAPAAGTGKITFYGVVNAVNGNNSDNGDRCSPSTSLVLDEGTLGIEDARNIVAKAWPNPVNNVLHLQLEKQGSGVIRVTNASGATIMQQTYQDKAIEIASGDWASGIYLISIEDGNSRQVLPIVKQ